MIKKIKKKHYASGGTLADHFDRATYGNSDLSKHNPLHKNYMYKKKRRKTK